MDDLAADRARNILTYNINAHNLWLCSGLLLEDKDILMDSISDLFEQERHRSAAETDT